MELNKSYNSGVLPEESDNFDGNFPRQPFFTCKEITPRAFKSFCLTCFDEKSRVVLVDIRKGVPQFTEHELSAVGI